MFIFCKQSLVKAFLNIFDKCEVLKLKFLSLDLILRINVNNFSMYF